MKIILRVQKATFWTLNIFLLYMRIMHIIRICGYKCIHVDIRIIRNRMANPNQ